MVGILEVGRRVSDNPLVGGTVEAWSAEGSPVADAVGMMVSTATADADGATVGAVVSSI